MLSLLSDITSVHALFDRVLESISEDCERAVSDNSSLIVQRIASTGFMAPRICLSIPVYW